MICRALPALFWLVAMLGQDLVQAQANGAAAPAAATAAAGTAASPFTHRPLRDNQPAAAAPVPTEPEVFTGYVGAKPFTVVPRKQGLALYPCSQCHKLLPLNPEPRKLVAAPHNAGLQHGKGRLWCLDCHLGTDRDVLHSLGGKRIDFNDSPQLCGQCHSPRHRDWALGAHGKRVAGWQGERQLYACTHCHDPHQPALQPRAPAKAPPVRAGLQPMPRQHPAAAAAWPGVALAPAAPMAPITLPELRHARANPAP